MVALDLASGRIVWRSPFGEYPELAALGVPPTGQLNFGGLIATGGGLLFATGTIDRALRAFDSRTGEELWAAELPAAGSAPPIKHTKRSFNRQGAPSELPPACCTRQGRKHLSSGPQTAESTAARGRRHTVDTGFRLLFDCLVYSTIAVSSRVRTRPSSACPSSTAASRSSPGPDHTTTRLRPLSIVGTKYFSCRHIRRRGGSAGPRG